MYTSALHTWLFTSVSAYRRPYWQKRRTNTKHSTFMSFGLLRDITEVVEILYPWGGGYNPWQYKIPYTPFPESNWSGKKLKLIVFD